MKVRIITGVFSLLLLFASTATTAGTLIIDFTADVLVADVGSPVGVGDTVTGHVKIDEDDLTSEDWTTSGEAELWFKGPNTFGSASASLSGWSLSTAPGGLSLDVFIEDDHVITTTDLLDLPPGMVLPQDLGVDDKVDGLSLTVYDSLGGAFGLFAAFDADDGVVELVGTDAIIDFDQLFSAAFFIGFWADYEPPLNQDGYWEFEGSATATATVVPVPAAVWLFGSGLLGLIGAARRKRAAA